MVKILPAVQDIQEMWVLSLGQEDPLEESMVTHSSILTWRISWIEEAGSLHFMESQRVRHDQSNFCMHIPINTTNTFMNQDYRRNKET